MFLDENNCQVNIYNSLGQFVKKGELNKGINSIDINTLKQGIYFYNIYDKNDNTLHNGKFIKE